MTFDETSWRESIKTQMGKLGYWIDRRRERDVPLLAYGTIAGLSLWPVVEASIAASQSGQSMPASILIALGSVAGGAGGNLIATQIEKWKERADGLTEDDIADWAAQQAGGDDARYLAAFDTMLARLDVLPEAQKQLEEERRAWFAATLERETAALGSALTEVVAQLSAIESHTSVTAQHTARTAETLDELKQLVAPVAEAFLKQYLPVSSAQRERATTRYLAWLVERYRYLDFRGMGISDRVSFKLPLVEMYVPLKARAQLPDKGETWSRDLQFAGRAASDEEIRAIGTRVTALRPVLDLLREYNGLILLGDPGAGKTTFLKYLAVRLALGDHAAIGLERRLPVLLPLSAYAAELAKADMPLDDFMAAYYRGLGIRLPFDAVVADLLPQGAALFLLDGLDEVQSLEHRHLVVDRVLSFVAFHQPAGNQFILTSRIVGYDDVRRRDHDLIECTLADFDTFEIEAFIDKWTGAIERAVQGKTEGAQRDAAAEKEGLLNAIKHNRGVRQLATNPLLLTILALMKRQGVSLPERRVELYDQYVKTLIRHWNLARSLDRPRAHELDVVETIRVLGALALWMQETSPGRGLVKQAETRRELTRIFTQRGHPQPEQAAGDLLFAAREYAGLLVARGRYTYGFIHLTFQEYLAAVGIAQLGQSDVAPIVEILAEHIANDGWREPTLLTIGYIGIIQQRDQAAGAVLEKLLVADPGTPGDAVILAGEAVADVWPGGVTQQSRAVVREAVKRGLVNTALPPRRRAQIGDVLARLGDDRPGVGVVERDGVLIPDIAWGEWVPAGEYVIGDDNLKYSDEKRRSVTISEDFCLARYPVTYVQFQAFAEAADFDHPKWWNSMPSSERKPHSQEWPLANRPRENVSWYQALAFCRWLSDKLGKPIDLPHEHEWEVAARYPGDTKYPWGDTFDPQRANTREGDSLGETSAVGMHPHGANEAHKLYDLSGNVWEWCRNAHDDVEHTHVDSERRTLRGGSWSSGRDYARVAYRLKYDPYDVPFRNGGFRVVRRPPSRRSRFSARVGER